MTQRLWSKEFVSIIAINLFLFLSFQMVLPGLPIYAASMGANNSQIGILAAILTVSSLIMRPLAGLALDEVGRRPVFLIGLSAFLILTFLHGFIASFWLLVFIRFLLGFGWGAASTASNTIASDMIPRSRFGEGMGYFSLSTALSLAIAPAIGLQLQLVFGFRFMTVVATVLVLIAFLMALPMPVKKIVPREGKRPSPYEKAAIRPAFMIFFITSTMAAISSFVALYAAEKNIENIAPFFVVYAVCILIARPVSGLITDRYGFRASTLPAFVLMMISLVIMSQANELIHFMLAGAFFGSGFAAAQTTFQTMSVVLAPRARVGAANATFFTGFDGGIGFGALLAGNVAQMVGFAGMYRFFLGVLAVAFVLYLLLGWNVRREQE